MDETDTISRQAAIDAIDKRFDDVPMELTTEILQLRHDLRERIPSAQPATNCSEIPNSSDDTISRQAAIDALGELATFTEDWSSHTWMYTDDVYNAIKQLPTIQPKRGRWIPVDAFTAFGGDEATWMAHGNPTAFHYCSVCKGQAYAGEDGESLLTDFCPNCGADMRGN